MPGVAGFVGRRDNGASPARQRRLRQVATFTGPDALYLAASVGTVAGEK